MFNKKKKKTTQQGWKLWVPLLTNSSQKQNITWKNLDINIWNGSYDWINTHSGATGNFAVLFFCVWTQLFTPTETCCRCLLKQSPQNINLYDASSVKKKIKKLAHQVSSLWQIKASRILKAGGFSLMLIYEINKQNLNPETKGAFWNRMFQIALLHAVYNWSLRPRFPDCFACFVA